MTNTPDWLGSIAKSAALWWATLLWVEHFTGGVSAVINWTKDAVGWILSANGITAWTVAWLAAPFALAPYAVYKWYKNAKENWVYRWIERWLVTYWIPAAGLWLLWLSIPLAIPILTAWAWMYWVRKLWVAAKGLFKKVF
jgi:hypothetical protein